MKKVYYFLCLFLFLAGFALLVYSGLNFTGNAVGFVAFVRRLSSIAGLSLIILALALFARKTDKKITLESAIGKYRGVVRLAEQATSDQIIQRDVNHLALELGKGNLEAGLGNPGHIEGTDIYYLRSRNGARLYYRIKSESKDKIIYEIVGKSAKGRNQDNVINQLAEIYSKKAD